VKGNTGARPSGCRTAGSANARGSTPHALLQASLCSLKAALLVVLLTILGSSEAPAQLRVLPDDEPQEVFTGKECKLTVNLHNPAANSVEADLRTLLHQASSATAVAVGEAPWKKLAVLPGQTVVESVTLAFPAVKAETRFLIQWLDAANRVVGLAEVLGYPPDLLKDLEAWADADPVGVLDPQNQLKPLLNAAAVEWQDLEDTGLGNYHGKLAIIGPFQGRAQVPEDLPKRIKALARKGAGVVWIQPLPEKRPKELKPSFYTVQEGKGAVVIVQADQVTNLAEKPQAQLNLIEFARLAREPELLRWPQFTRSD